MELDLRPTWTLERFTDLLDISRATAYRWLENGRVQGVKTPGGKWRIPQSEVERIMTAGGSSRVEEPAPALVAQG